ncbi:MAG: SusD/RagB family nutrient-binding outer membrane lipoprotein [Pedobacter sp.]|nr:SusD/RagB family nutrient-binding outer membrane lipoprotein [Pedobacter sp.]
MKKIFNFLLITGLLTGFTSCKKYLDINENPNQATVSTPSLVLPQAIVGTASISENYNSSYYTLGGFSGLAYGFGGAGVGLTYAYTATNFTGLFTSVYDNCTDYQYVIDNTVGKPNLLYANAIARIMKSYQFGKLVDQYNDVPYSDALKGAESLAPKYDKAEDIYKDLISQLNLAITGITTGQAGVVASKIKSSEDPLFKGNMDLWKVFANTVKLRLLVKMAGVPAQAAYATAQFASFNTTIGVLIDDALVNPGYVKEAGRQNPSYSLIGFGTDNQRSGTAGSNIPTIWAYSFYNTKISDPGRGSVIYRGYPSTPRVHQGTQVQFTTTNGNTLIPPTGFSSWFTGVDNNTPGLGVAKGPSQGQSLFTAAEAQFLLAEAYTRGYLAGNAATAFNAGITASFTYLYKNQNNVVDPSKNVATDVATYLTDNNTNKWVNFSLNTSLAERIEAIITQKYISLNMIHCDEAYNEFRRTEYPKIVNGSAIATETFASIISTSTRPDKLVGRVLYPQQEFNLNGGNVPAGITLFGSRIFWDLN